MTDIGSENERSQATSWVDAPLSERIRSGLVRSMVAAALVTAVLLALADFDSGTFWTKLGPRPLFPILWLVWLVGPAVYVIVLALLPYARNRRDGALVGVVAAMPIIAAILCTAKGEWTLDLLLLSGLVLLVAALQGYWWRDPRRRAPGEGAA